MQVEVLNLKRYFGRTRAVDDITFALDAGQVFGFVGPNGAGKTTTLRILATLDEPTAGDARIDGISVLDYPEEARRRVGYMPDSLPAHADMTVHEYLDFFARAFGLHGPRRVEAVERVEAFTGLAPLREKLLRALSKGMKQRVSLARALIHDPSVLIMDEPAAGLDPRARIELRELILALGAAGKAVLISSHILTELAEICNGVVIIEQGRIRQTGRLADLLHGDRQIQTVAVRALGTPASHLQHALLETPGVQAVRVSGAEFHVDLAGGEEHACSLLARLVSAGHRIVEFRRVQADLEDVFLRATNGELA